MNTAFLLAFWMRCKMHTLPADACIVLIELTEQERNFAPNSKPSRIYPHEESTCTAFFKLVQLRVLLGNQFFYKQKCIYIITLLM